MSQLPKKQGIARELPTLLYCDDVAFDAVVEPAHEDECKCFAEDMRHEIMLHQSTIDGKPLIHWWMECKCCNAQMAIRVMSSLRPSVTYRTVL